jgi:hypothetical protein
MQNLLPLACRIHYTVIEIMGAGLYEKQNAYFAHFQKRPSSFSYFSHNIQQVAMGYIIRK